MKILLIGGTGTISTACADYAVKKGFEVTLLNRGNHKELIPDGARLVACDINDEAAVKSALSGEYFDAVADFIAFKPEQVERDIRMFSGICGQYIFISSASAYQKPCSHYQITESTPLYNPYWQYSRDKIACEDLLMAEYRKNGFPITIIRPSHTYGIRTVPLAVNGSKGSWQVIKRILDNKPVLIHGDGLSWWTFTHNTDFAKAFAGLLGNIHATGHAFHITSDEKITWNAAYEVIGAALGRKVDMAHASCDMMIRLDPNWEGPLLGDKANSVIFDNSKIKQFVPGFNAEIRFDEGIRLSLEYMLSHKECQIADPEFDAFTDKVVSAVRGL